MPLTPGPIISSTGNVPPPTGVSPSGAPPLSSGAPTPGATPSDQPTAVSVPKHKFPLAAAGVLGAILSFTVVSAIIWGLYFFVRKRRRANKSAVAGFAIVDAFNHRGSMSSTSSGGTVPQFIGAADADALHAREMAQTKAFNPFAHPHDDASALDPFAERSRPPSGTSYTMSV